MKIRSWNRVRHIIIDIVNNMRLKNKLILAYSFLVLIPILGLGISSFYISKQYIIDSEKKDVRRSMVQLSAAIDNFFEIYFNKSEMLFINSQLQNELSKKKDEIDDYVMSYMAINDITNTIISDVKYAYLKNSYYFGGALKCKLYVKNASIVSDGSEIYNFNDIRDEAWIKELYSSNVMFSWQSNIRDKNDDGKGYIVLNRRLINFENNQDLGVMRLFMPMERIENIILKNNSQNPKYQIIYTDGKDNIIASDGSVLGGIGNTADVLGRTKFSNDVVELNISNNTVIAGKIVSEVTGWCLYYLIPTEVVTGKIESIFLITFLTMAFSILLCIIIAMSISSYVTNRLGVVVKKTKDASKGIFSVTSKVKGNDEIAQLDRYFNDMMGKINNLIEVEYKSKILINQVKLELLQKQINPHIYYNSITMISVLAKKAGHAEISFIANHLIQFYKGILNKGKIISSIDAEVNMVKSYIEIMKFAYELDINTVINIDEQIRDCYSIRLFLQPLVENAVMHGIKPNNAGCLTIRGEKQGESLIFSVSDNGVGIKPETLELLNSKSELGNEKCGYGLFNVMKRIDLFFGQHYGIEIKSEFGKGTDITVRLPAFSEEEIKAYLKDRSMY